MGRGIIGKSKGDAAMDKMEKFMERSARERERRPQEKREPNPIIRQLKELYPNSWEQELEEMKLEARYPEYLNEKTAARAQAKLDYYNQPRRERENETEQDYVRKTMNKWKHDNRNRFK